MAGQNELHVISQKTSNNNKEVVEQNEVFATLDSFIDDAGRRSEDFYPVNDFIRGHDNVNKKRKLRDLKPIVFLRFNSRAAGKPKVVTLKALLDSGASASLIAKEHTSKLKIKPLKGKETVWTTPAGPVVTATKCRTKFLFGELHPDRAIEWDLHVAPTLGSYDVILGRDIMQDLGIDLLSSSDTIAWDGAEIPMKDEGSSGDLFHIKDSKSVDDATERLKSILDAKYTQADLAEICREQEQLSSEEQTLLLEILKRHEAVFDGTLGTWNAEPYNIELKEGAEPHHARSYPIPHVHTNTLKMEVQRLCDIGVLKKVNRSEWAAPTFIIPKKDKTVRFISDFRELNKRIKRKPFPIPKIQDLLLKLEGFTYATSLDLNMGYYHIELSPKSKELCTIVLPFGKYEYQRLPMGLSNSPDIFQERMSELFSGFDFVRAYLDDLLVCTSGSYEEHLEEVDKVLSKLQEVGLRVNAKKSFFAKSELEYLGFWVTRAGIQPLPKKVQGITSIASPKNRKEVRSFIGMVNFYRDMWIRRSHLLAPLAALTSKNTKFKWGNEEEQAFQQIKKVMQQEVLLAYPDFSIPFDIHTDASHLQLGAVISQNGKPVAFYSRKLNAAQTRYTTTERELLSIVETLKEFRNILLGHKITVYTDHKNLTYKKFNTERVMRWRLLLEEYGPELVYIKGPDNIVADSLSRLGMNDKVKVEGEILALQTVAKTISNLHIHSDEDQECFTYDQLAERHAELFADVEEALPFPAETYPIHFKYLKYAQEKDQATQRLQTHKGFGKKAFRHGYKEYELIHKEGRIVIPTKKLQKRVVEWYHSTLLHPGETRTELTITQNFYWPNLKKTVKDVTRKCEACQLQKYDAKKYGQVPAKVTVEDTPWRTACIDLLGPYEWVQV